MKYFLCSLLLRFRIVHIVFTPSKHYLIETKLDCFMVLMRKKCHVATEVFTLDTAAHGLWLDGIVWK